VRRLQQLLGMDWMHAHHALAIGGDALGQDGIPQLVQALFRVGQRRASQQQHVQVRHVVCLGRNGKHGSLHLRRCRRASWQSYLTTVDRFDQSSQPSGCV
jgi:hypothetical protein